jgi:16S rRNA (guanine527-N7)-methyltransferase
VEHNLLQQWAIDNGIKLSPAKERVLLAYAESIYVTNKKYNLTGYKTVPDIIQHLIIESIDPILSVNVPRGTIFADIGTGAGIPGIPLAIFNDMWNGVLIDSNNKKISFIQNIVHNYAIDNLHTEYGRIEELAHGRLRDSFDYVFSRAVGEIYFVIEVGAPMVKMGGILYIYSNVQPGVLPEPVNAHAAELGLSLLYLDDYKKHGFKNGLIFIKSAQTDTRYPRAMPVIKREINKLKHK